MITSVFAAPMAMSTNLRNTSASGVVMSRPIPRIPIHVNESSLDQVGKSGGRLTFLDFTFGVVCIKPYII